MKRYQLILSALLALAGTLCAQQAPPDAVPEMLIVQHRRGADRAQAHRAFAEHGARVEREHAALEFSAIRVPEAKLEKVRKSLEKSGLFTFVERDFKARAALLPNDPGYGSQWYLPQVSAPAAWDLTTGSASVPIALIDSGVDPTHPDLASRIAPGWSFLTGTANTADVEGHGTATAGMLAVTDNSGGISGVNWKSPIVPLVVLDSTGYASYYNIANAITYAADHGIRVISISIAGSSASSTLQSAIDYAWNHGSIVIAAAGNSSTSAPYYPAACNHVVAVSATDSADALASFSNYGSYIDIAAPGTMINTTTNGGGYGYWQGTSFSAPIVAAVTGLILSAQPTMTNTDVVNTLLQNTDDIGAPGFDNQFGWGRVNAYKAVMAARLTGVADTTPPTVTMSNPVTGSTIAGGIYIQGTASDNIGVTKIEFYVDGLLSGTVTSSPYSFYWNSGSVPNAIHTLKALAYDAAGNTGSYTVSVTTNNVFVHTSSTPPKVVIKSPGNGVKVSGNTKISVSATTSVGSAPPTQVSIYVDNVVVYTATSGPYNYMWNVDKVAAGAHTIYANAWGDGGVVGTSSTITVYK